MAAPALAGLGGILSGFARAAATSGVKGAAVGAVGNLRDRLFNRNKSQEIIPAKVSVVEGMATAVKGSAGGGGALVPTGGGGLVSRKSSAIVPSGGTDILTKFDVLIGAFKRLIEIEEENKRRLEQQILDFARSSEKQSRSAEQSGQEKSKEKAGKNPIIEGGKKAFKGIFGFIADIVKAFITYKILDWISKPENTKAIQNTIQFFMNVGKLLGIIGKFVIGPIFNIVKELATGGLKLFGEIIEAVINIFSLKWLTNPLEFLKDLMDIPKILVETTFKVIHSVIDFLTFGLVRTASETIGNAVKGFFGLGEEQKTTETTVEKTESPTVQQPENPLQKTGKFIKGALGAVLNPIGAIGNAIGGMFGKGDGTPQLREGGIVGKKQTDVSVKPLDKLSTISGVAGMLDKTMGMFMKLLTMPFKLIGAAMIALVMNTVGRIPGVHLFLKPIVDNIISAFDLPPAIANIVGAKQFKQNSPTNPTKQETKPTATQTPPPAPVLPPPQTPPPAPVVPPAATPGATPPATPGATPAAVTPTTPMSPVANTLTPMQQWAKNFPELAKKVKPGQSGYEEINGGWITGPQSGYPVSLNGGLSTSFIGHGTEWVGTKKASGGNVNSVFVVPFDTPSTRSNGGLVSRRIKEAKSGGYALPFSSGGVVKTDGIWDTGPGYTVKGHSDQQGRPIVFSQPAAQAFAQMITASGGKVRGSDVASSKRSPEKNRSVGGVSGSKHMTGLAMDIHGQSNAWIRQNGAKYGWVPNDYPGSHGGHFEFKGAGLTPSGTSASQQQQQDGTQPDKPASSDSTKPEEKPGFMGSGASTEQLIYLMQNLGMSKSGSALSDVQAQNIVSQSFAGAGKPGGVKVIAGDNKDISSAMETIQSASLGSTLPPDGKWVRYAFNL